MEYRVRRFIQLRATSKQSRETSRTDSSDTEHEGVIKRKIIIIDKL
jgi:hypothetical protein